VRGAAIAVVAAMMWAGAAATDACADAALAGASTSSARWTWPLSPPRVIAPFAAPPGPYAAGHRGIDLAATPGAQVMAPAGGVLTVAQTVVDRPVVTIKVDEHVLVSMEPVTASVAIGAAIAAGQPIGVVAAGGHCDGRCVHLGVRVDGEYVSPLLFLAGVPPAVLLPVG